jgi:hypothetical protein
MAGWVKSFRNTAGWVRMGPRLEGRKKGLPIEMLPGVYQKLVQASVFLQAIKRVTLTATILIEQTKPRGQLRRQCKGQSSPSKEVTERSAEWSRFYRQWQGLIVVGCLCGMAEQYRQRQAPEARGGGGPVVVAFCSGANRVCRELGDDRLIDFGLDIWNFAKRAS